MTERPGRGGGLGRTDSGTVSTVEFDITANALNQTASGTCQIPASNYWKTVANRTWPLIDTQFQVALTSAYASPNIDLTRDVENL